MTNKKTWKEFRDLGLLWWINTLLHAFGWAIVFNMEGDEVLEAYPARVKYRGFDVATNTDGYQKISKYMKENAEVLEKESLE